MEAVETGVDPPLQNYDYSELKQRTKYKKVQKNACFTEQPLQTLPAKKKKKKKKK